MASIIETFIARGDLAHLALFLWASGASTFLALILRELSAANRRFDAFVGELARFNLRHSAEPHSGACTEAPVEPTTEASKETH
ncbi:hypothetical protein [Chelatococcus asaccharovorans]|uniref:Uncharacterized protein n=1 Tax=Chelatococcus asaccharovorans TaxID=28210 RepID=A0A2V3U2L2_9HYPH|nr:hypothetical protein [Chelatococcus asaccharovorans]MBS7702511.1 hypothetical protein [Chelatococcus asaccharovorans]PXW56280.1 hypothetical protein C7450_10829 [Chelatococcus asaccharovorans]CAH1671096.1 conserved hypothetical protein [Chelatococcus asaccharovorans]CAH1677457.1 conserved hypothetical protein [Chelatococcus asaccharovorans]